MKVGFIVVAFAVMLTVLASRSAHAQTAWEKQVKAQLAVIAAGAYLEGSFEQSHQMHVSTLSQNTYRDVKFHLDKGTKYSFVAVCDEDCTDVDLKFYDDRGNLITQDTESDAYPEVKVTVKISGFFFLRVTMARCNISPCWMGLQAYRFR